MTKFEELCWLCGVGPESDEAKAISDFVDELICDPVFCHTDTEIFSAAIERFRKPTIKNVYDFCVFYEPDDEEAQHRYVVASSEEEATAKLEANLRELEAQGFMYPCFITNPTVELARVIV